MDQQKIIDEIEYYKAQTITELLYASGKITFDEYDKLTDLNRKTFSPLFAETYCRNHLKNHRIRVKIRY